MKNLAPKIKSLEDMLTKTTNLFTGCPQKNIFYLHIPKCGGTSLNKALQSCYLRWSLGDSNLFNLDAPASWNAARTKSGLELASDVVDDSSVMKLREELLLYSMSQKHIKYISGHFTFSQTAYQHFADKYCFITILRDPVQRWISSYFYNRYRQKAAYRKIATDIDEYLDSEFGRSQGYEYAKFLCGNDFQENYMSIEAIEQAKKNLHKFHLIGFLEDMNLFQAQFEKQFGKTLKLKFLNQSPNSESQEKSLITEAMKKKIATICEPDMEIYQYAFNHFR